MMLPSYKNDEKALQEQQIMAEIKNGKERNECRWGRVGDRRKEGEESNRKSIKRPVVIH